MSFSIPVLEGRNIYITAYCVVDRVLDTAEAVKDRNIVAKKDVTGVIVCKGVMLEQLGKFKEGLGRLVYMPPLSRNGANEQSQRAGY